MRKSNLLALMLCTGISLQAHANAFNFFRDHADYYADIDMPYQDTMMLTYNISISIADTDLYSPILEFKHPNRPDIQNLIYSYFGFDYKGFLTDITIRNGAELEIGRLRKVRPVLLVSDQDFSLVRIGKEPLELPQGQYKLLFQMRDNKPFPLYGINTKLLISNYYHGK